MKAPPHRRALAEQATLLLATPGLLLFYWALGGRFHIPYGAWQLLSATELRDHLLRSLWDLHSQPPLLNWLLGVLLQLASATGVSAEALGAALHLLLAAAIGASTAALALRLVPSPRGRAAVYSLLLLNPFQYAALSQLLYTPYEQLLLLLSCLACLRLFEAPSTGRLVSALAPAWLLVHLRSLYHPLWFVLLAAGLVVATRKRGREWLQRSLAVAALAVVLALAWPAKNLYRFGFFGSSSWAGYNLSAGLPLVPDPDFKALFLRVGAAPRSPALEQRAATFVPEEDRDRPALCATAKPDGSPNWNHLMVLAQSQDLGLRARAILLERPAQLLHKARLFYLRGYARFEGADSFGDGPSPGGLYPDLTPAPRWARAYETVVYQRFRPLDEDAPGRMTTLFAVLFPLLLAAIGAALWRRRRSLGPDARAVAVQLFCVLWNLALICGVDGFEGNRMRFPTQALLVLSVAWALSALRPRQPA